MCWGTASHLMGCSVRLTKKEQELTVWRGVEGSAPVKASKGWARRCALGATGGVGAEGWWDHQLTKEAG